MPEIDIKDYEKRCQTILQDNEVRFAALLNEFGDILAGGYKKDMNPRLTKEQHDEVCRELASRVEKRKNLM